MNDYYVYVYIDPRSYEEFYYGKGRGSRRYEHLSDGGDSEKARLIRDIKAAGLNPIVKVIARDLSEDQALLVEKTLIWKLGRTLTNKSSGHFAAHFRPHRTFDRDLPGFDFANDVYYVNVGEGEHRSWDDCHRYGFLAAGHGPKWRDQICRLLKGDAVVAYLAGAGYVGLGVVQATAVPANRFKVEGTPLGKLPLTEPRILDDADSADFAEYLVGVKWRKAVPRHKAFFKSKSGLFTTQLVRASLSRQPKTIAFLEESFGVSPMTLLAGT